MGDKENIINVIKMGYWEEKKEYEEELEENKRRNSFCSVCGRKLNDKNTKGMCVECGEVICTVCGMVSKGKIICSDCKESKETKEKKSKTKKKRLYRSKTNKVIAGVCGGIGEYFNIDPIIIRILWILFVFLGGSGILAYIICWLIIPKEE